LSPVRTGNTAQQRAITSPSGRLCRRHAGATRHNLPLGGPAIPSAPGRGAAPHRRRLPGPRGSPKTRGSRGDGCGASPCQRTTDGLRRRLSRPDPTQASQPPRRERSEHPGGQVGRRERQPRHDQPSYTLDRDEPDCSGTVPDTGTVLLSHLVRLYFCRIVLE
jgi:hypothetical protein